MQQYKNKTLNPGMRNNSPIWLWFESPPLHLEAGLGKRAPSKEPTFPSITLDIRPELVLSESLTDFFDATRGRGVGQGGKHTF